MIHLRYSNYMEPLLIALEEAVLGERSEHGIWQPIRIIVPNQATAWCIERHMVQTQGISANLDIGFLGQLLHGFLPEDKPLIDRPAIQGILLRRFQNGVGLEGEVFAPVRQYLKNPAEPQRVAQLSYRLGGLLEEYLYSRPNWAHIWESATGEPSASTLESCQRALWRLIQKDLAETGQTWLTPLEASKSLVVPPDLRPIHLFGMSHLAYGYHMLLDAIGKKAPDCLRFYTLNPCREFWEDHPDGRDAGRLAARRDLMAFNFPEADTTVPEEDPYGLQDPNESILLRRWGRAGREKIRVLNELGDWEFQDDFQDPGSDSLLHALQQDILCRRTSDFRKDGMNPADGSIQVHACPNPHREAETLCDLLWDLFRSKRPDGSHLRYEDVAIMVPSGQLEAYAAHVSAAFSENPGIPLTILGQGSGALAQALEAFQILLHLPESQLSRADILGFLEHPAVRRKLGDAYSEAWSDWCRETGIVRGKDRADLEPTYFQGDILNWDQGHRRLALGAFLGSDQPPFLQDGEDYPAREIGSGELASAGTFILRTRALLADLRSLKNEHWTLQEWSDRLCGFAKDWLGGDDRGDEAAAMRLQRALMRMGSLEPASGTPVKQAFGCARELALQELQRLEVPRGSQRFKGVVLGDPASLRGLPFQVVIMAGMGEGAFPGQDAVDDLDLRLRRRLPGDVPASERDRFLFLEALLAARERFIVSYVAKHPLSGDVLQPSPVVTELLEVVGEIPKPGSSTALVQTHPLRRWDPDRFAQGSRLLPVQAAAYLEARAELRHRNPSADAGMAPDPILETPMQWPVAKTLGSRFKIRPSGLRDFLASPLQGWAKAVLRLRQEDEDPDRMQEEPAVMSRMEEVVLLRDAFWAAHCAKKEPETAYARGRRPLERAGAAPLGLFSRQETERHLQTLAAWRGLVPEDTPVAFPALTDARKDQDPEAAECLGALRFDLDLGGGSSQEVELTGPLSAQGDLGGGSGSILLLAKSVSARQLPYRDLLAGWIDHLVLAAKGKEPLPHVVYLVGCKDDEGKLVKVAFDEIEPEVARKTLEGILLDLLTRDHACLMPIEATMKVDELVDDRSLTDWAETVAGSDFEKVSCDYGPVANPRTYPPPSAAVLEAWRGKLRLFLEARVGDPA